MSEFLTNNNAIFDTQFGFRRKCITVLGVIHSVADYLMSFYDKTYCTCLFLDLRKAFDTVNVEILVDKKVKYIVSVCTCHSFYIAK